MDIPHLAKCALVHGIIDALARVDSDIGEMVREDRIGFDGPGPWAPVDHVAVYADGLHAALTALQTVVAIAQLLGHVE